MESFKRGWGFLKQAWQMALKDKDLIKPSIYALIAGFIITLVLVVPVGFATYLLQDTLYGRYIIYVLWAIIIFIQYITGYVFSAMTVYLIFGYLAEGDGRMDKAWGIVRRDLWDIASLAAASTLVNLLASAVRGKDRGAGRGLLAGIIEAVWTEAAFLILPAMVIEDINLKGGIKRATQIIKENLLLVGISTVGVKAIVGWVGFLLGTIGVALGLGVGLGIISVSQSSTVGLISGVTLGILIATPFILFATVISTYTATAYHTCLYLWARDVERARLEGQTGAVTAPGPLASVLQ
ncbi:MAG: hypothetical protein C3F13_03555 [Anaerolineales bacterium]|nr:hypothetical protein [Anaerolineae bacterium]PWB55757.1 MAG: hypothetical protein C3F13_03555 [Anaerolineales bacterium]